MKWIGALLIILSCAWLGYSYAGSLEERVRQLRLLRTALQSLEAEILFGHAPLHEASRNIAKQFQGPVQNLFEWFAEKLLADERTAAEAWRETIMEIWRETSLKNREQEILLQFGETLGKHDLMQQQKQIQLALVHLEREELDAREREKNYGKMAKSLGLLTGLLLVILLF